MSSSQRIKHRPSTPDTGSPRATIYRHIDAIRIANDVSVSVELDRPVYSLAWASRHGAGGEGVEKLIERYSLDTVVLQENENRHRDYLTGRYGRGIQLAGFNLLRVRPAPDLEPVKPVRVVLLTLDTLRYDAVDPSGDSPATLPLLAARARSGVQFTRFYASTPLTQPTHASLLTGLMPSQHGVHRYLGGGGAQIGAQAYNTLEEFATLPSILTKAGYVAGLSGKCTSATIFVPRRVLHTG